MRDRWANLPSWVPYLLALIAGWLIWIAVSSWLIALYVIPSASMTPTLKVGGHVTVNRLDTHPERGQMIVFRDPGGWVRHAEPTLPQRIVQTFHIAEPGAHLAKRVIAVGGDRVACDIRDDRLKVNGTPVKEPYLAPGIKACGAPFDEKVPKNTVWVMGDNRPNSLDSRTLGPVPTSAINGVINSQWDF